MKVRGIGASLTLCLAVLAACSGGGGAGSDGGAAQDSGSHTATGKAQGLCCDQTPGTTPLYGACTPAGTDLGSLAAACRSCGPVAASGCGSAGGFCLSPDSSSWFCSQKCSSDADCAGGRCTTFPNLTGGPYCVKP